MLYDNFDGMDYTFLNLAGLTNDGNKKIEENNNLHLFSAKEGFLRGNMFANEYKPYKNLTYVNIMPKSDREAKLFTLMQYSFAINDLNLYLDLNPNDREAFQMLKSLIDEEKSAKEEYINRYGSLEVCDVQNDYDWINSPWPWEDEGGNMYV